MTRQESPNENGAPFFSGDVKELIAGLRENLGGNIYCDGGAEVVKLLMEYDLIDEHIVSTIPVILGDGIRLFSLGVPAMALECIDHVYYDTGLVKLHYRRRRDA